MSSLQCSSTTVEPEHSQGRQEGIREHFSDDTTKIVDSSSIDPQKWPLRRKWVQVLSLTGLTFMAQYAGSSYPMAEVSITKDFDTNKEITILGNSALLVAYAVIPMFLAPLAESFGRKPLYLIGFFLFLIFTVPTGETMDISVMIIFRFVVGMAGSVGNTMVGGSITDMFETKELGIPMAFYIIVGLLSSTPFGPLISGFIVQSKLPYHWVFWVQIIAGVPLMLLLLLFLEETRPMVLLKRKVAKMNKAEGCQLYKAKGDDESILSTIITSLQTPWQLMFTDWTVAIFSLWLAFAWGLSYGMLQSISYVFRTNHNFTSSQIGLVFISPLIALLLAIPASILQEAWFHRQCKKKNSLAPESRLEIACLGSICMTAGLFVYAWTSPTQFSPFDPIVGIGLVFFGIFTVFYSVFLYISDNYASHASSALSAAGFWRNILAAAFPLFTEQMYRNLTPQWASSTLGFISIPLGLIPFVLRIYGPKIRKSSKWIET